MNTADEQTLKSLQDQNTKLSELNSLLEDLIKYLKDDQLKALQDQNAKLKAFNTLLGDLIESQKKDALARELHQTTSSA